MQKMNDRQGFGTVEIILVVLVVAVLGFGGWFVWQRQKDTKKITPTIAKTTTPTTSTSPHKGVLYIKEWSVSLNYNDSNASLEYALTSGNNDTAYITSSQLAKAFPGKCDLTGMLSATSAGSLTRTKASANSTTSLGGYDYSFTNAQQACTGSSSNSMLQSAQAAATSIFK